MKTTKKLEDYDNDLFFIFKNKFTSKYKNKFSNEYLIVWKKNVIISFYFLKI